jgi:hypothetical protein
MPSYFPFLQFGRRRDFLRVGVAGLAGMTLASMTRSGQLEPCARAAPSDARARRLILVWLGGGPATLDMWDMKPDAPVGIRGEFQPIGTTLPGVFICEHLPQTAKILDRCVLIRSLHHNIAAHGPGAQLMMTGQLPSPAIEYPSLGSISARLLAGDTVIPPYITIGNPASRGAGYLGSAWNPFEVDGQGTQLPAGISLPEDVTPQAFAARIGLRNRFDARWAPLDGDQVADSLKLFHRQAVDILRSDRIRAAFDLQREDPAIVERYGRRSQLGQNALRARRLVEAGARFITIGTDGWDTHSDNFSTLRTVRLPQLDRALAALIGDLAERGMLSDTLVCCCGEFGRTPIINGNRGRDHWSQAMSVLLAGGGLKSGLVYGATDDHGREPVDVPCTPADLGATLLHQLGIPTDTRLTSPGGRPMAVVYGGNVLRDIVA